MVWPFSSSNTEEASSSSSTPQPRRSSERISRVEPTLSPRQQEPRIPQSQSPSSSTDTGKPQLLLEETTPRFNNGSNNPSSSGTATDGPALKQAISQISLTSFSFSNLTTIPCFRDAGLTGFSAMFVLGTIMLFTQKSIAKATNWSIAGLLLGSTVSWEQCRSKRRKEFEFTQRAREVVASKEKPMVNAEKEITEEVKEKRDEVSSWWKR